MSQKEEYKKIYMQEVDELLQQMNKDLLILEKEPQNSNALNAIFRSVHTLKGMSASMGYGPIAELAHRMEDVLAQLRDRTIEISNKTVDLLFKSFDSLESMVAAVQEGRGFSGNRQVLLNALDKIMVKAPQITEERITEELSLNIFEKKTLARVKKQGYFCYHIQITLSQDCVLKGVRAFMIFRNLHTVGEVIKSVPSSQDLEEEKFGRRFDCIFVSKNKKKLVKNKVFEILDVEEVVVKEIPIDESWEKELPRRPFFDMKGSEDTPLGSGMPLRKIQSVRIDINRLDKLMNLVEELAINKLRLFEISSKLTSTDLINGLDELSRITDDLQIEIMQARLVPVGQIFDRFPRLVRDVAKQEQKKVRFEVIGSDIELDRPVLDEISDPLIHLLKNAVDHGIESPLERKEKGKDEEGRVLLSARREKSYVFIAVEDDGEGIDIEKVKKIALECALVTKETLNSMSTEQILLLTAHPGFSTKDKVTDISGRGVGLDVAKEKVENLGGGLLVESISDKGTRITMRLPITTAVVQALLVRLLNITFAIPVSNIVEIILVEKADIKAIEHQETILHRDKVMPIVRLRRLFSLIEGQQRAEERRETEGEKEEKKINVVIVEFSDRQFGIVVEKLIGQQHVVIKQLTRELRGIRGFTGATILGDGSVALVLDVATLI